MHDPAVTPSSSATDPTVELHELDPNAADPSVAEVERLKRRYLSFPAIKQVDADLERLLKYGALGGKTGTSASTYMLIAETGGGKTALLRRFLLRHPKLVLAERDEHPVLYVEVPPRTSRKALAETILRSLGAFIPANTTEVRSTARAIEHLAEQRVRVLILDEAQHLIIPEKKQLNYEAADWVKGVANAGVCAVVLAGVPDAWEAYLYNGQLRRRSFGNRRLTAFRRSVDLEWKTFQALLRAFGNLLPFPDKPDLSDRLTALRFLLQCEGLIGRMSDFLATATIIGLETGARTLDVHVMREASEQLADLADANWVNPFDLPEKELEVAIARLEEAAASRAGVERKTGLRRGQRGVRQEDVIG